MRSYGLSECETPLCSSTRDVKPIQLPPVWVSNRGWISVTLDVCEACRCLDGRPEDVIEIRSTLPPLPAPTIEEEGEAHVQRAVA